MRMFILFFVFLFSSDSFSQVDETCEEPVQGTEAALELASAVSKISEGNFSEKFCKAFAACSEFQMKSSVLAQQKEIEDYYKNLPKSIEERKAELEAMKAKLVEMKPEDSGFQSKQDMVDYYEKSLAELEVDKVKYDLHLSDPAKYPHPMKEKGIGLTPEEKIKFDQDKMLEQWGNYFENYASQHGAHTSSEVLWSEIDALAAVSPIDWASISSKYQTLSFSQTIQKDLALAQAYKNDPSKLPEILKEKGIGLTPEEIPAFQKKQAETFYEALPTQIAGLEKIHSIMQKKVEEIKAASSPAHPSIEQWGSYYQQQIEQNKQAYAKYLAYKNDPSSDPDFLASFNGGGFGGYGGYGGGYAGGYASFSGGGMVGGSDGGTSSDSSCSQAQMMYSSATSTMTSNGAGSCGLTEEQMSALKYYSDSGYGCLNSYLRSDENRDENIDYLIKVLNEGLDKLPSYRGIVKRGATLPESIRNSHGIGAVLDYEAFTSTSTNSGFSGEDMFIIQSETGKPIMGFSSHRSENEVLFKSGTQFKVLDKKEENGVFHYILAEVPSGGKKLPTAGSISARSVADDGTYQSTQNPDSFLCPVDNKLPVPRFLDQTVIPRFTFPGTSQ